MQTSGRRGNIVFLANSASNVARETGFGSLDGSKEVGVTSVDLVDISEKIAA